MLVIRLSRVGKKKQSSYRMVVQDKRKDPWGKALDYVGFYNPKANPKVITLDVDKIKAWIAKGAMPSATIHNLLVDAKVITGAKMKATKHDKADQKAAPPEAPKKEEKAAA